MQYHYRGILRVSVTEAVTVCRIIFTKVTVVGVYIADIYTTVQKFADS